MGEIVQELQPGAKVHVRFEAASRCQPSLNGQMMVS